MNLTYALRRLFHSLLVLLGISVLVFFTSRLKGDPILLMVQPGATAADIAAMRERFGLDKPLWLQYGYFIAGILRGDLGLSLWQNQSVVSLVLQRLSFTLLLSTLALVMVLAVGIPTGVGAAYRRGTLWDRAIVALSVAGQALPVFWTGVMLILLVAVKYRLLPTSGIGTWKHLVLPVVTLGFFSLARITRITRAALLEVLQQEFVRTARSKGVAERTVVYRHAVRNALLPVITIVGLEYALLLGGSVVTETIFALPGLGRLTVQAVLNRDFPLVQGITLFAAVIVVTINFGVDLLYAIVDPRITYA